MVTALSGSLVLLLLIFFASCARDRNGYVRVNQLGYESGSPMRAYFVCMLQPVPGCSSWAHPLAASAELVPLARTLCLCPTLSQSCQ